MNDFDIHHGDLRRLDLNLLVAFDALMQERHVSRAAARLFLGQPAMSHVLARLREALGDPLFLRSGSRMEPTARAMELAPQIRQWLEDASRFLFDATAFDPAQTQASFSLSAPDGLEALLFPGLIATLREEAPGIQLRSFLLETDQQLGALDRDEVDLLITAAPYPVRDWHHVHPVMESGFVALYSRQQMSLPDYPTLGDLSACDQLVSSHRGTAAGVVDHVFAEHGLPRRIVALSASLMATGRILANAPLISIQPELYLPLFADYPDLAHVPLAPEIHLPISLIWHRRNDAHPLHDYLRTLLIQRFASLSAESRP